MASLALARLSFGRSFAAGAVSSAARASLMSPAFSAAAQTGGNAAAPAPLVSRSPLAAAARRSYFKEEDLEWMEREGHIRPLRAIPNVVSAIRQYVQEGGDMPRKLAMLKDPRMKLYVQFMREEKRRQFVTDDHPRQLLPFVFRETYVPKTIRMVQVGRRSKLLQDLKRRKMFQKYELTRLYLKSIAKDERLPYMLRVRAKIALHRLPANSAPTRIHYFCPYTGRARGLVHGVGISRLKFRDLFSKGLLQPFQKAIW